LAQRYSAPDLKRFADHKRYALMLAFLLETRKSLLDHLVLMHDQYVTEMCRHVRHRYEQQHRELRKRQKRAIDVVLETTERFLDWPDEHTFSKADLWQQADERQFRGALSDLRTFQRLEERGYGISSWRVIPVSANILPSFCIYRLLPSRGMPACSTRLP